MHGEPLACEASASGVQSASCLFFWSVTCFGLATAPLVTAQCTVRAWKGTQLGKQGAHTHVQPSTQVVYTQAMLGMVENRSNQPRGKMLGGSSCANYMLYVRGSPHDFNSWCEQYGCAGWSYADVLPFCTMMRIIWYEVEDGVEDIVLLTTSMCASMVGLRIIKGQGQGWVCGFEPPALCFFAACLNHRAGFLCVLLGGLFCTDRLILCESWVSQNMELRTVIIMSGICIMRPSWALATCNMQHATCNMQDARCNMRHATCDM